MAPRVDGDPILPPEGELHLPHEVLVVPDGQVGYRDGGLITEFVVGDHDVLYPSRRIFKPGKIAQRGGSPVLFPNPGPAVEEKGFVLPQHGFARDSHWQTEMGADTNDALTLINRLSASSETYNQYPYVFGLDYVIGLEKNGAGLQQILTVENNDAETMPFCFGFHPYFAVPLEVRDGISTNIPDFKPESYDWTRPVDFPHQPIVTLEIPGVGAVTMETSDEFDTLVIWSEPDRPVLCIEPWRGYVGDLAHPNNRVNLPHGRSMTFRSRISFDPV